MNANISSQVTEQDQSDQTGGLTPSGAQLMRTQLHDIPNIPISPRLRLELMEPVSSPTIASYKAGQLYMPFRERFGIADLEISVGTLESPQETSDDAKVFRTPQLTFPTVAHPVFTDQVRRLLYNLWAIVVSRAAQLQFPISKTVASTFTDTTNNESKAILSLTCQTNISQALAFWDSLEPDLQNWLKSLSAKDKSTFLSKISLSVYWQ